MQDIKRRIATCFVVAGLDTRAVAGYYSLSACGVSLSGLAAEDAKKLPRYPVVPAALLGRLAVDSAHRGKGLGSALLADAFIRTAPSESGVFAMVVDAKDEAAQRFYERHGFTPLPGEARRLCLPIATALKAVHGTASKRR